MNRHSYAYWGVGHMSDLDDPRGCCSLPEQHYMHRCPESVDWLRYCGLPFGHDGACEPEAAMEAQS